MNASESVKKIREVLGINRTELAQKLNITKTAVYNYEHGLRIPKLTVVRLLLKLANKHYIKISADDFLN